MRISKKDIFYTTLFTVFLLAFVVVISVTDSYVKTYYVGGDIMFMRYVPGILRTLGFISFYVSRHFLEGERIRKITLIIAGAVYLASTIPLVILPFNLYMMIPVLTLSLAIGHLGGLVYYCMSLAFSVSGHKGKVIGAASSVSILMQYLLTGYMTSAVKLVFSLCLFLLIIYMSIMPPADYVLEDALPYAVGSEAFEHKVNRQLILIISIVLICTLLACRTDIAFVSMSYEGNINIYSYPRLFMIAGYLTMGYVADLKDHRIFNTVFFAFVLLSAVLTVMPSAKSGYTFFLSIYYLYISIYIFFYTYGFISIAPRTGKPELWASVGRPLSDLFTAVISVIMIRLGTDDAGSTPFFFTLYYVLLLIVLYMLMSFINTDPNLSEAGAGEDAYGDMDTGAVLSMDEWLDNYPLTPRERDVAFLLIESDAPIKAIAAELGISERSVYRFAASIYEKTGADNRTGLVKKFISK